MHRFIVAVVVVVYLLMKMKEIINEIHEKYIFKRFILTLIAFKNITKNLKKNIFFFKFLKNCF